MKKGEQRKQELLQIAYEMFISRGYENTSVDDIIEKAGIAKGTYYYYFESKEQTLEEVIGMMIEKEAECARKIISEQIPVPQKIVGIIASIRPAGNEKSIEGALMRPENIIMHNKIKRRLVATVTPLLSEVVKEGISEGIFDCDNIPERVRILLAVSGEIFDEGDFTDKDISVFIDMAEKLLGAERGTMEFIRGLIR
ncbi:MAG: TetR/AcrR family transcriptional regulator [Lachnospiraceae bacterium]|nr:TetR/AcrR family transcriptional regulator [Lachnospiraceae bacterium]